MKGQVKIFKQDSKIVITFDSLPPTAELNRAIIFGMCLALETEGQAKYLEIRGPVEIQQCITVPTESELDTPLSKAA